MKENTRRIDEKLDRINDKVNRTALDGKPSSFRIKPSTLMNIGYSIH